MSKNYVLTCNNKLKGVFTNKSKVYGALQELEKTLEQDFLLKKNSSETMILRLSKLDFTSKNYVKIYDKEEIEEYNSLDNIEYCPSRYDIYLCDDNTLYDTNGKPLEQGT